MPHFDICLMNPPYNTRRSNNPLHFTFVDKCLELSDKQIVIMPSRLIDTNSVTYNTWKEHFSKYLCSVEKVNSNVFNDTSMTDVAIYYFNSNKRSEKIEISLFDNNITIGSLMDLKSYDEYEYAIMDLLKTDKPKIFNLKTMLPKSTDPNKLQHDKIYIANKILPKYEGKAILSVNIANGGMNGTYVNDNSGKIFTNSKDIIDDWIKRNVGAIKYMYFDTVKEARNCLSALKHPLLRFALYRTQDDQNMNIRCYKYIPNIDWSDDRVKTDEGLLEVCGCPKDKCKEYADYCKDIIDKVDRGERP